MTTRYEIHAARPAHPSRWGFTLVELLLVMFILSVLVGLVVGVSWYVIEEGRKKETLSSQKKLMAAIDAYRKVTGHVPGTTEGVSYEPDSSSQDKWDPARVMGRLLICLTTGEGDGTVAVDFNSPLYKATLPFLGDASHPPITPTTDAYGKPMLYLNDKGVGGKPVIVSAGPDGKFGYEKEYKLYPDRQKQYQKDNIRSDMN
jgi:prepilin-type N-terminal cleavage/methylation domain-containing protein